MFQTTVGVDPHDTLLMIEQCTEYAWDFVGHPDIEDGDLELIWRPDCEAPQLRIRLRPDGTWTAYLIVKVGDPA